MGDSLVEADAVDTAKSLLESGRQNHAAVDATIGDKFDFADAQTKTIRSLRRCAGRLGYL